MTRKPAQWLIRLAEPDDIAFIYSTWLRSYRTGSGLGLDSGRHAYFITYQLILDQILQKKTTKTLVACKPDETNIIWAYLVQEEGILHYVFVKDAFRKLGLAKSLYDSAFEHRPIVTHMTALGREILKTHAGFSFDPSFIFPQSQGDTFNGIKTGNSSASN